MGEESLTITDWGNEPSLDSPVSITLASAAINPSPGQFALPNNPEPWPRKPIAEAGLQPVSRYIADGDGKIRLVGHCRAAWTRSGEI